MITFLKKYWIVLAVAVVVIGLGIWASTRSAVRPPLSPAAENAVRDSIKHDQQKVGTDTARAHAAATSGGTQYEAGTAYANVGKVLNKQSKPHAKPTPSDTAAERLQRELSGY